MPTLFDISQTDKIPNFNGYVPGSGVRIPYGVPGKSLESQWFEAFFFFHRGLEFVISGFRCTNRRTKLSVFRLISTLEAVSKGLIFCGRNTNKYNKTKGNR